jgi:tetratricopeptide (TPR) repeat protein
MPKPSPAKKKRTKKAAKPTVIKQSRQSKDTSKVLARKTKGNEPPVRKAALGARGSLIVSKRAQASYSKRAQTDRSVSKLTSKDGKPRQPKVNPVRTASVKQYEAAVRLLYSHEYEKAKVAFEKVIAAFADDKEVVERSRIHLRLCEQKIARKPAAPRTLDEHYDWAIALMNEGKYEESIDHLNKALKSNPKCDYVIYALAITHCRTGNFDRALASLQTAIGLRPENRFLAQRDSDFEVLKQDSRFVSLVFPDQPSASIR